jgi:heat shock protein HslJ
VSDSSQANGGQADVTHHWVGTYAGTLPCADCEGIEKRLTLNSNMTYRMSARYLAETPYQIDKRGNYSIDKSRSVITLEGIEKMPAQFLIGKNLLTQLDMSGNRVSGKLADRYQLARAPGSELVGIRWNLIELMGKQLRGNPAYVMFDTDNGLVRGFAWCNTIRGSFEIEDKGKISFGPLMGTSHVCADSTLETQLLNLFGAVDQYDTDDQLLTLFRVKEQPLAIFRQAELRMPPQ